MTQLTPTLYAVEVPLNAYDFSFRRNNQIIYLLKGIINPLTGIEKSEIITIDKFKWGIEIKDGELLGTVTPDLIDFDCDFIGTKDAFRGLMYSKGCDLTKKHVIIKSKI